MLDALYISATGLRAQQQQIDVISNNVANLQTPGFKRSRIAFAEMALTPMAGNADGLPQAHGAGTSVLATLPVMEMGEMRMTRNPLDLGINGGGFLEVVDANGALFYTRAGQLRVDDEGHLAIAGGQRLASGLQVPPDATGLRISPDGVVFATLGGDTVETELGRIELASFAAPDALQAVGGNLFAATASSGEATLGAPGEAGMGRLLQGFLEMGNVDLIDEMSTLVLAQRAYQLNARVLQASDQILETINNLRR